MLAAPTWASVTALTPDGAGLPQVDPGVDRGSEVAGGTESATTAQGKQSALQANSPVDDPETVSSAATSQALGPLPPLATPQLTPVNPIPFDPRTRAMARTTMAAKDAQESTVDSAQAREVDPEGTDSRVGPGLSPAVMLSSFVLVDTIPNLNGHTPGDSGSTLVARLEKPNAADPAIVGNAASCLMVDGGAADSSFSVAGPFNSAGGALSVAFVEAALEADSSAKSNDVNVPLTGGVSPRGKQSDKDSDALAADGFGAAGLNPFAPGRTSSAPTASQEEEPGVQDSRSSMSPAANNAALHAARVVPGLDRSEVRIGLQSDYFGKIQLHTSLAKDQVGAEVATSHQGLRDALLVEGPSLEKAMARQNLRLDSVTIETATSGHSQSNSFGRNETSPSRQGAGVPRWRALPDVPPVPAVPVRVEAGRVDIHA